MCNLLQTFNLRTFFLCSHQSIRIVRKNIASQWWYITSVWEVDVYMYWRRYQSFVIYRILKCILSKEVFAHNKKLTLLYKIYISKKKQIASSGNWSLMISDTYPAVLVCHPLPDSDYQILIKSYSMEFINDPSPESEMVYETKFSLKMSYSTHVCLVELDKHQTSKPVMVSCEFNSHWRQL